MKTNFILPFSSSVLGNFFKIACQQEEWFILNNDRSIKKCKQFVSLNGINITLLTEERWRFLIKDRIQKVSFFNFFENEIQTCMALASLMKDFNAALPKTDEAILGKKFVVKNTAKEEDLLVDNHIIAYNETKSFSLQELFSVFECCVIEYMNVIKKLKSNLLKFISSLFLSSIIIFILKLFSFSSCFIFSMTFVLAIISIILLAQFLHFLFVDYKESLIILMHSEERISYINNSDVIQEFEGSRAV